LGLSFREYLSLVTGQQFSPITFDELLSNHVEIARRIVKKVRPLEHFSSYLQYGYYPYFLENNRVYAQKLAETISLTLNMDLPALHDISLASIEKIRLLLHIIAESVPFKPNISTLSERVGVSRNTLVQYLHYLEDLRVIRSLYPSTKDIGALQKPEKIYLYHPNLHYALASTAADKGNIRESYFISQVSVVQPVTYSAGMDFTIGKYQFEVGGREKKNQQAGNEKSYVANDDTEIGHLKKIPLWLVGFLY
jgi:predicted AAA+ superfamily ATPase